MTNSKPLRPVAACLLLIPLAAAAQSQQDVRAAARLSDRMLAALVEASGVPGMGAAVVRNDELLWSGSAGLRDVKLGLPVDARTKFRLASVSKVVTATAAAQLVEQGTLDADAPVQTVLPWLDASWPALTPRQLAAHTSGLPHYQPVDDARGGTRYAAVRDAVRVFEGRPLITAPGAAYAYSSWGYTLLSAVVEASARQPFLEFVRTRTAPGLAIGADATGSGDPDASQAYAFVDGGAVPAPVHDFSYTWGGGGLMATPGAIAQFGARLMAGGIVAPPTWRWMQEPTPLAGGGNARERDYDIGFGWRVGTDADGRRIAHHAGVAIGARSALVLWPEQRLVASVLSNAMWTASIEQTAMMLAAPFDTAVPALPAHACPVDALRYEGEFDGKPVSGEAHFTMQRGNCEGHIAPGNALGDWLNGFEQKDVDALRIIGLDASGGLSRAALVTPIGIFDLRAQTNGRLAAQFSATRALSLRLVR
jgi:serine beta-lactamase-like protein LACTB